MYKLLVEDCQKLPVSLLDISSTAERINIGKQVVRITSTKCTYGGARSWFVCPQCGKRVGVLYRKPFYTQFLCRHCQNLTYRLTKHRRSILEGFYKKLSNSSVKSISRV